MWENALKASLKQFKKKTKNCHKCSNLTKVNPRQQIIHTFETNAIKKIMRLLKMLNCWKCHYINELIPNELFFTKINNVRIDKLTLNITSFAQTLRE